MYDDIFGTGFEEPTSFTDTAQICLNGHIINDSFQKSLQLNKKYCPKCGEPTITECPECHKPIAGEIHYSNVFGAHDFKLPSYCIECGNPYPWTQKNLKVAKELTAEVEGINTEERGILDKNIDVISKDSPEAKLGATRIKKIFGKLGSATGEILKQVIIDLASETAKKIILGS